MIFADSFLPLIQYTFYGETTYLFSNRYLADILVLEVIFEHHEILLVGLRFSVLFPVSCYFL